MARMTTVQQDAEQAEFAVKAASHFAAHPEHSTFGDTEPGSYLALRWGMGEDCVKVVMLDNNHEPTVYQQIIKKVT
jgi:hypothetical protein